MYYRRRPLMKRRRVNRRKPYLRRRTIRRPRQPIHYFKRTVYVENWVTTGAAPVFIPQAFALNDLATVGETDFTNLFDMYKINAIKVEIIPRVDTYTTATPGANVVSVIDYNDIVAPANFAELQQYQSLKMTRGRAIHRRFFRPRIVVDAANSALNTRGYIPTSKDLVLHYGLKWGFDVGTPASYSLRTTYYMAFKTVK